MSNLLHRFRRFTDQVHQWFFLRKWDGMTEDEQVDVVLNDPMCPRNWTRREVRDLLERGRIYDDQGGDRHGTTQ